VQEYYSGTALPCKKESLRSKERSLIAQPRYPRRVDEGQVRVFHLRRSRVEGQKNGLSRCDRVIILVADNGFDSGSFRTGLSLSGRYRRSKTPLVNSAMTRPDSGALKQRVFVHPIDRVLSSLCQGTWEKKSRSSVHSGGPTRRSRGFRLLKRST
jgi:hypothetical protein